MLNSQPPVLNEAGLGSAQYSDTDPDVKTDGEWIQRARLAWITSRNWFDSSVRTQIRKNISNFRSLHPEGSKYKAESFRARSKVFRPKTRANVRRIEAAVAVALFATSDLISITSYDQGDPAKNLSAKIKQRLLQYRLEHRATKWFLTCIGAAQDAGVTGVVISHQYWQYRSVATPQWAIYKNSHADGNVDYELEQEHSEAVTENRPVCDLIAVENFGIDPACDWRDPIHSSPYLVLQSPTYVGKVKEMIENGEADALAGKSFSDALWWAIASNDYDSIRAAREGQRMDKYSEKKGVPDAETIWIRKHIHRIQGRDWYWETVGDILLFRRPQLLVDAYPHLKEGERPFVMGMMIPEAHKVYPTASVQLAEPLQEEINDVANLQLDTVKMSTFGRWKVTRNAAIDIATLKAGVPQSVIAVDKQTDIEELKQADVPRGSFVELDRLQTDLDDVLGNFSPASAQANKQLNETIGGLNLLSSDASQIKEMEIRCFTETWAEPVLQQMYDMECTYESDEEVLNDVAAIAGVAPQQILQALKQKSRVRINVGFNATSPEKRIGRLMLALTTLFKIFPNMAQQADQAEIRKEVMGAVGFEDGERFFPVPANEDPVVAGLRQQLEAAHQQLAQAMFKEQAKVTVAEIAAVSRERVANITGQIQYDIALLAHAINTNQSQLDAIDRQIAQQGADLQTAELQLERSSLQVTLEQNEREFALKMHEAINGKPGDAPAPGGEEKAPYVRAPHNDGAGTIQRGDYGNVPFAAG